MQVRHFSDIYSVLKTETTQKELQNWENSNPREEQKDSNGQRVCRLAKKEGQKNGSFENVLEKPKAMRSILTIIVKSLCSVWR